MVARKGSTLGELVEAGVIKQLNPELAAKAIEGYKDELAPAARVQEAFYRHTACPDCGGNDFTRQYIGGPRGQGVTWTEDVLPNAMLRCSSCHTLFNPQSGIIVETGFEVTLPEEAEPPGMIRG